MSKYVESIDRRAQEYAEGICPNNEMGQVVRSTAYAIGAIEERKELIEKACEWLKAKNEMCMFELEMILGGNFIEDFKKAMEE